MRIGISPRRRIGLALLLLGVMAGEATPQDPLTRPIVVPVPPESEYRVDRDLLFRERGGRRFLMDVFTPVQEEAGGIPAVVFVHGGPLPESVAAQGKDLGQYQSFAPFVTGAGLAGVVFSHGMSSPGVLQDAKDDVAEAIRYLRTNATALGIDPDRLCIVFVSAGGLFVAPFLEERPAWLKCVVLYYPVLRPGTLEDLGVGAVPLEQQQELDPFPFIVPAAGFTPAVLVAEAGRDAQPIVSDLRRFGEAASRAGWKVVYLEHPDGPHGFDVFDPSERSREILGQTLEFLQRELGRM